jgi:hypothetical protein
MIIFVPEKMKTETNEVQKITKNSYGKYVHSTFHYIHIYLVLIYLQPLVISSAPLLNWSFEIRPCDPAVFAGTTQYYTHFALSQYLTRGQSSLTSVIKFKIIVSFVIPSGLCSI